MINVSQCVSLTFAATLLVGCIDSSGSGKKHIPEGQTSHSNGSAASSQNIGSTSAIGRNETAVSGETPNRLPVAAVSIKPIRAPRYLIYLYAAVDPKLVVSYEERDDKYLIEFSSGGSMNLGRELVERIVPIGVSPPNGVPVEGMVQAVIDGETIKLNDGNTVRLIGVATSRIFLPSVPVESVKSVARTFSLKALEGESIRLTYDPEHASIQQRDSDGRLLAYVTRIRDDFDVNAELIRNGYAHANLETTIIRLEEFQEYERKARRDERGLWRAQIAEVAPAVSTEKSSKNGSAMYVKPRLTVYVTKSGTKYHRSGCQSLRESRIPMALSDAASQYGPCSLCKPP